MRAVILGDLPIDSPAARRENRYLSHVEAGLSRVVEEAEAEWSWLALARPHQLPLDDAASAEAVNGGDSFPGCRASVTPCHRKVVSNWTVLTVVYEGFIVA